MLSKLLRYEFAFYLRVCGLSYAVLAAVLLLVRLVTWLMESLPEASDLAGFVALPAVLVYLAAFFVVMAVLMLPTVLAAVRFYKNLIRDEGYLSFTLPVKASSHVFCKIFTPSVFTVLSAVVTVLLLSAAIFVFSPIRPDVVLKEISTVLSANRENVWLIVMMLVQLLLSAIMTISLIALSCSLGQLFRKQKLLGSIGCYIGCNMALNLLNSVASIAMMMILAGNGNPGSEAVLLDYMMPMFGVSSVISLAVIAASSAVSSYLMTHKLNLE